MVQDGDINCAISGMYVAIYEYRFAGVFNFPTDGLTDLSAVPNDLVSQAIFLFSKSGKPVQFSCNKRLMKYEFRLLNDILAKSITVKAGSFNAVTHERFLMLTVIHFGIKVNWRKILFEEYEFRLLNDILAKSITVKAGSFNAVTHERFLMLTVIHFGIKVNWRKILFEVLKEMADITTKRAKGFEAQICVLLKGNLAVTLGEANTFPPLKILSAKTMHTYITTNKTIDARGEYDEPEVAKVAIVKKKSISKNKSVSIAGKDADDVHVEVVSKKAVSKKRPAAVSEATVFKNKRTKSGKTVSKEKDLALISVAQDVEPISVVPAERPHKRKAPNRKLSMTTGFDDEIVQEKSAAETFFVKQNETTSIDDVDNIIEEVITATAQLETEVVESDDITDEISERLTVVTDEESMSIEDLLKQIPGDAMCHLSFAAEPTKIKFGLGIQIPRVHELEQYKANLPNIAATNKGKETLVVDTIKGHPAHEIVSLICADIDFLIQIRKQVIEAVAAFFNSFSIRRLSALGSLEAIAAKEEKVLNWGETDSVQIALQRRSTRSVFGKCVYLVTLAMSLFDLQDVCIAIGSIATLDLPMVVDLIGIYGLKGPYCTLTTTNWFLQALSLIPRESWGDVAICSYHDPMGKSGIVIPEPQWLWAHG
ncbi:plasma membrane ATPase 1-like [Dorcoceras hygrometricum]|nr:plasma membrane ATPase 1-like [Dorcoceras hygrometricum]